ncbi:MAG: ABC transporter permease [Oscillospiraceae bacterium]|nr:ABC transporter permease [Oscillospiraceae bacterium]
MVKYIAKRVLMMIPVLLGVILLVFFIMNLASGNAVLLILGENATEEAVAVKTRELGLDRPILVRYAAYVADLVRGDMGTSYFSSRSVAEEVLSRFPATLKLAVVSAIISTLLAIPLGIFAAVRQNTLFDNFSMILSLVGNSMPAFWLALMLMMLFAEKLGWLPAQGMNNGWRSYVLPAVSIGFINMAAIARTTRSTMLETVRQDYIRTARAKGVDEEAVVMDHAFPNALIPTITVIGVQFGNLLGGAILVETVFAWPGLGRLMVQSVNNRDVPLVLGCIVILSISYSVVNLLVDLVYGFVDPRVRSMYK